MTLVLAALILSLSAPPHAQRPGFVALTFQPPDAGQGSGGAGTQDSAGRPTAAESSAGWWILAALIAAALAFTRSGRSLARGAVSAFHREPRKSRAPSTAPARPAAAAAAPPARSPSRQGTGPVEGPRLVGIAGEMSGTDIELGEEAVVIGRDPRRSQLVLSEAADGVSGQHCRLRFDSGQQAVIIEDLGSTNGTFLQSGRRLATGEAAALRSGDRFYVGDSTVCFEVRY